MNNTDMIDIDTHFVTLIGDPLKQSFAARMQNSAYEAMGINMHYFYTEAGCEHLGEIINGIRNMPSFIGCAVTKPNKIKVLDYLDELDPLCRKMGACNTVLKIADNKLIGYNTDGLGFKLSIENETDFVLKNSTCVCLGAGGAGRAICFSLAFSEVKKIYITDIYPAAAELLVNDVNKSFGTIAQYIPIDNITIPIDCELLINATGIGMGKRKGETPVSPAQIPEGIFCFDACYNPNKTQFLIEAEKRGCRILNGLGMSLYQGAAQIEIWTGKKAPVSEMKAELLEIISEKK